jgi:hypothetical protein
MGVGLGGDRGDEAEDEVQSGSENTSIGQAIQSGGDFQQAVHGEALLHIENLDEMGWLFVRDLSKFRGVRPAATVSIQKHPQLAI